MAEEIALGLTASLRGRYAWQGRQALAGVEAWVEDVNVREGLLNRNVKLIHYDDQSKKASTQELYRRLIEEDKVDVLLGPYSTVLTKTAAQVALERGRVLWNHGGALTNPLGHPNVISILSPARTYFHGLIDILLECQPKARTLMALYSAKGNFPRAVAEGAAQRAEVKGFSEVISLSYESLSHLEGLVKQAEKDQPDILLGAGSLEEDVQLAKALLNNGISLGAVGLVAAGVGEFHQALEEDADGFYGPSQWEPTARYQVDFGPPPEECITRLRQKGGVVEYPMAQAYATGLALQRCIEEAGSLDRQELLQAAHRLDCTTFFGRFRLDPLTGEQLGHKILTVQWRGGEKVVVWPKAR